MQSGESLGPYRIIEPLGAGGMGEVWLAEDTRLHRRVAVKMLPDEFADDPDRLERFELEARAAAALNHPHIAAVYDVGREHGTHFMVQEFLDGLSLGDTLAQGRLPMARVVTIAEEVAKGLAVAHAAGIVHRDIKPDNLFLTRDGHAKILDFGLAKASRPSRSGSGSSASNFSRTPTSPSPTGERMVGSVGYMSPEQVEGGPVDLRSDFFSLGCVLYEMLSGAHPFKGRSVHQTIDQVLHDDPSPIADRAPDVPVRLQWIIDKCLAKEPDERYQGAVDLAVDLRAAARDVKVGARGRGDMRTGGWRPSLLWSVVALLATATLAGWAGLRLSGQATLTEPVSRYFVNVPPGLQLALSDMRPVALSADGTKLAYVALHGGTTQIYVRDRDRFEATAVVGTEAGSNPFFSPDGRWLGFFSGGKLRKVALAGGAPITLADTSFQPRGASWGSDGTVVFAGSGGAALERVAADGGPVELVTTLDTAAGETGHRWPHVLPGAEAMLFTIGGADDASSESATIAVMRLSDGSVAPLLEGTAPSYLPTGHILFARAGSLLAAPFDPKSMQLTGPAALVIEGVAMRPISGVAYYAVSESGTLAYVSGLGVASRALVWVDRDGSETGMSVERRAFETPRLSPDGARVAVTIQPEGGNPDVWVFDIDRGTTTRLTYDGMNGFPVWTPDGRRIAFTSNRAGGFDLYWKLADGSVEAELLHRSGNPLFPDSFSGDGETLAYTEDNPETASDLWALQMGGDPTPVVQLPFTESGGAFSPAGHWLAYVSDESGRDEIFVRGYPEGGRWQVSTDGGNEPVWSGDGSEFFYRSGNRMMAVDLSGGSELQVGTPTELFSGPYSVGAGSANFAVNGDGGRFLMIRSEAASAPTLVNVVANWSLELGRTVQGSGS